MELIVGIVVAFVMTERILEKLLWVDAWRSRRRLGGNLRLLSCGCGRSLRRHGGGEDGMKRTRFSGDVEKRVCSNLQ